MLAVFTVDNLGDAGLGSLRQAIGDANLLVGADTVEFQAGLSGTIALTSGELSITDELTIDGPGAEDLIIDAQQNSRIFHIAAASGPVTLEGLHLTGGHVGFPGGGAILSETDALLSIESSTISGNSTVRGGGGIRAYGDVTVTGSTFSGNSAASFITGYGGGIFANGDVAVTDGTFSGNSAGRNGGGIYAYGDVAVTSSTFSGNAANGFGGGIHASDDVTIADSTMYDNSALFGGGISAGDDVVVTSGTISGNAAVAGGGIRARGDVTVSSSTISGNSATGDFAGGGGIAAYGDVTVNDSTISGNSAMTNQVGAGGGIKTFGNVTVTDSTISGNSVMGDTARGGGIYALIGDFTIIRSTISGNSATGVDFGDGGGIFTHGDVAVTDSTVSDNSATSDVNTAFGGGIGVIGDVTITRSTISGNSATGGRADLRGGGVYASGDVTVTDSTISGNSAASSGPALGGGIFAFGHLTVTRSTISANSATGGFLFGRLTAGGGIWVRDDPVTIENSIVAGNQAGMGLAPDLSVGTGPLTVRYSLIGDNTGTGLAPAPVGMPDANGNLIGTDANPIDPLLGPLQDNGGPTFTHALLGGSPAINAGDPGFVPPPDFDQRGDGFVRVFDGRIDMGAFELQPATLDEKIQHLLDDGVLNRGQANSLLVKLNSAGNERAQLNRLRAFINEVNALVRAGILSAAEGQKLIDGAESLRMSLSVDAVLPLLVGRS